MADAHITMVIDRSGSMGSTLKDAQGGLDSFVASLGTTDDVTISLIEFDNDINVAVPPVLASAWPGYSIVPRGSTALLDAIGFAVGETKTYLATHPAEKVVLVVITDGGENSSREFSKDKVTELIDGAKTDGWEIVFLASDLSAAEAAVSYGVPSATTRSFAARDSSAAYEDLAMTTSSYLMGARSTMDFEDSEVLKEVK